MLMLFHANGFLMLLHGNMFGTFSYICCNTCCVRVKLILSMLCTAHDVCTTDTTS